MTVVVTGATEHLGINLIKALVARQIKVRAVIPGDTHQITNLGCETFKGDVRDLYSLNRAFEGAELAFHAACIRLNSSADWPILESINISGTHNVVEACLNANVGRFIFFSSISALKQEPLSSPLDESRPLAESEDDSPFARSMAAAEREVRKGLELGLDTVLLNPSGLIGPNDHLPSHVGRIILTLAQGNLPAVPDGGCNLVDVRDVAEVSLAACEKGPTGARYLLSGAWVSFQELAALIEKITGKNRSRLSLPSWLARGGTPLISGLNRISRQRLSTLDAAFSEIGKINQSISHDRASRELNFKPRELNESLADTLRWYQQNGQLDRNLNLKNLPLPGRP